MSREVSLHAELMKSCTERKGMSPVGGNMNAGREGAGREEVSPVGGNMNGQGLLQSMDKKLDLRGKNRAELL